MTNWRDPCKTRYISPDEPPLSSTSTFYLLCDGNQPHLRSWQKQGYRESHPGRLLVRGWQEERRCHLLEMCPLQNWLQSKDHHSGQAADFPSSRSTKRLAADAVSGISFEAAAKLGCRASSLSRMARRTRQAADKHPSNPRDLEHLTSLKDGTLGFIPCSHVPILHSGSSWIHWRQNRLWQTWSWPIELSVYHQSHDNRSGSSTIRSCRELLNHLMIILMFWYSWKQLDLLPCLTKFYVWNFKFWILCVKYYTIILLSFNIFDRTILWNCVQV